jgi:hypothetical protein
VPRRSASREIRIPVVYQAVRDLAAELARLDCVIITGGGPGLMKAANEGVHVANPAAAEGSIGIRVDLPFEPGRTRERLSS